MSNHLLIAGTGRAGTSALVRLLDAAGLKNKLSDEAIDWDDQARAGLETIPGAEEPLPYVIKSPWAHQFVREFLRRRDAKLDGIILPVRALGDAAVSRVIVELAHVHRTEPVHDDQETVWTERGLVTGGTVNSLLPVDQERLLAVSFYKMVEVALDLDVPLILLQFPRFVRDAGYSFQKLRSILPVDLSENDFKQLFDSVLSVDEVRVGVDGSEGGAQSDSSEMLQLDNIALKRELARARGVVESATEQHKSLLREIATLRSHYDDLAAKHHLVIYEQSRHQTD